MTERLYTEAGVRKQKAKLLLELAEELEVAKRGYKNHPDHQYGWLPVDSMAGAAQVLRNRARWIMEGWDEGAGND